jgi:hypothetical protein
VFIDNLLEGPAAAAAFSRQFAVDIVVQGQCGSHI